MAKIYGPPEEVGDVPDFQDFRDENGRYDFERHMRAESEWIDKIADLARRAAGCRHAEERTMEARR